MARGNIKEGETIILKNIEISLTRKGGSHDIPEWYGSFKLPEGKDIDPGVEDYRLELNDGRSGHILIRRVKNGFVQFQGSGGLTKEEA
jgi:hypothetical protein